MSQEKTNQKLIASEAHIDLEAKSLAKANAETLAQLKVASSPHSWNDWVAQDLAQDDWVVLTQLPESYKLPAGAVNFLGNDLVDLWNGITSDIAEIHEQVVGLKVNRAGVTVAGDERIFAIGERLKVWADKYLELRLSKTCHRQGGPVKQFQFLYAELLPHLEEIAFREKSANRWFFGSFVDYLPTMLFLKTWQSLAEFRFNKRELVPEFKILSPDLHLHSYLAHLIKIYQWHHMNDVSEVLALVNAADDSSVVLDDDVLRRRLELLVDDIQEMRPFLRHNFKSENVLIELAPGLVVSFLWAVGRGVGLIMVAPSAAEMLKQQRSHTSNLTLTLTFDGLLANFATPWIDTDTILSKQPEALRANLKIVEAVHAKLYELYEKIDVKAVAERFRERVRASALIEEAEPSEEEFAALCQVIAEPVDGFVGSSLASGLSAVRAQRLLAVLADKLKCEVRQGKGSEIVVYREGGHHFRLGHHKRNSHVPTAVIKNLLKHVGVSTTEWLEAII